MIRLRAVLTILLVTSFLRPTLRGAEPPDAPLPDGAVARLGTTRLRTGGTVQFLAFSPDGKRLASWSAIHFISNDCYIWDVATGRELRRVELAGGQARTWAWLADGRGAAVVQLNTMSDRDFFLWDFATENAAVPTVVGNGAVGLPAVRQP